MARPILLPIVCSLLVLCAIVVCKVELAADEPQSDDRSDPVQQLMLRVAKLEARVAELEKRPPRVVVPRSTPTRPPGLPKGSVPKEFNGLRYYIVPTETPKVR